MEEEEESDHSPTSSQFQRFKLLVWKSYLWHRYYWWWTLVEIITRCFFPLYLSIGVSKNIELTNHPASGQSIQFRNQLMDTLAPYRYLAYTPTTNFTEVLMENVRESILLEKEGIEQIELVPLHSERKLEEYLVNRSITNGDSPLGIVFVNIKQKQDSNEVATPHKLHYDVRQSIATDTRWLIEGESELGPQKRASDYWVGGFAAIQLLINEEFIKMKLNNPNWSPPKDLVFQTFPYPEYQSSAIEREDVLNIIVYAFIAAEVALSVPFIASIIIEKQNGVKSLLRIHHMEETMIWLGWLMKAFVVIFVSVTFSVIFMKIPFRGHASELARRTDPSVLWIFFILFSVANLCLVLFLSSFFNKITVASLVHMFIHYFSIAILHIFWTMNLRRTTRLFWPSPSMSILKGIKFIATAEVHGIPYTWSSVRNLHSNESYMTLLPYLIFYVADIVFYTLLAIFFGFLNSGEYGSQKSPLFLFRFFIYGSKHKHPIRSNQVHVNKPHSRTDKSSVKFVSSVIEPVIEPISGDQEPSLRIEGLHKEFDPIHVLERVDLEFYENEICVLLGPKNSGKTTLFSILAGSITYEDGFIYYKGIDVSEELDLFTNDLGICFEEDRLFHYLTVEQHLLFFGMLKGLSKEEAADEAEEYMTRMEIYEERDFTSKNLSKLVKRKLCIAIGLVGERKVLILDEPMKGLDHNSKMNLWNLLLDMRENRTIIVSTSDSREAESLADRIAIMENGVVIAHGTPKFLENNIGMHYELLVSTSSENFDLVSEQIMNVVDALVEKQTADEIVYRIPIKEESKFSYMFANLERRINQLEISNMELMRSTIEHALMSTKSGDFTINLENVPEMLKNENDSEYADNIEGFSLRFQQLRILLRKKILYMIKDYVKIVKRIILPTIIAFIFTIFIEEVDFKPYLLGKMSPSIYVLHDVLLGTLFPQFMIHKINVNDEVYERYSTLITNYGGTVVDSEGSDQGTAKSLLDYANADLLKYRRELLALFVLKDIGTTKIMYNLRTIHALPIAISLYSNVLLRTAVDNETTEIITRSHPIPRADETLGCISTELFMKALIILVMLYFMFAFLTIDVILYLFELSNKEVVDGLMYLQIMSGVPVWVYWLATFIFDLSFFTIVIFFRLALFIFLDNNSGFFDLSSDFGYFVMVVFLFGTSSLIYVYIFSFFYKPAERTYYTHAFVFNFACNVCVAMCYSFSFGSNFEEKASGLYRIFSFMFFLIPFLNFPWTVLQYMAQWYHNHECFIVCSNLLENWCAGLDTKQPKPYLEFSNARNIHGILLEVTFLFITLIFGVILFVLINFGLIDFIHNRLGAYRSRPRSRSDLYQEDIDNERDEIQNIKSSESRYNQVSVLVDGLNKTYLKVLRGIVAVENMSFIAENGTIFGILGKRKAGKTTTFHMMADKIIPTDGDISVEGVTPNVDRKEYFSLIGYCPQTSPLLDKFSGRQILELIVSLKGFRDVTMVVDEWISFSGLEEYQHMTCDSYSYSIRRLLSVILSLVGNPRVVFLDEPTSDVDSFTKRHLYGIIEFARDSGKTVVLGSPSATECELLCNRLTILINGVVNYIGNVHDLKTSHRLGYFLTIKVDPDVTFFSEVLLLEKNILNAFGPRNCKLLEEYRSLLYYQVVDHSLALSTLFEVMEDIKNDHPVMEDYSVTTTTLTAILESLSNPNHFFSRMEETSETIVYQK